MKKLLLAFFSFIATSGSLIATFNCYADVDSKTFNALNNSSLQDKDNPSKNTQLDSSTIPQCNGNDTNSSSTQSSAVEMDNKPTGTEPNKDLGDTTKSADECKTNSDSNNQSTDAQTPAATSDDTDNKSPNSDASSSPKNDHDQDNLPNQPHDIGDDDDDDDDDDDEEDEDPSTSNTNITDNPPNPELQPKNNKH